MAEEEEEEEVKKNTLTFISPIFVAVFLSLWRPNPFAALPI